jgi:methylglutaconyl-CoA hydratase
MTDPPGPAVGYAVADGVATLTLDRPDARNVLNPESLTALLDGLGRAADDDAVRVVVLASTGPAFCAGADMRSGDQGVGFAGQGPQLMAQVLATLLAHPRPTIARVQGHVAGGGNGLVASCDLAVAAEDARFAFSEVRVGVAPAVISVACLRVMPPRHAAELLLTGERISAARALQAGLVTTVVPLDALDAVVEAWVGQLRQGGPQALATTKQLLRTVPTLTQDEAFAWTATVSATLFAGDEAAEGMAAFLDRRPARWTR